jgi:DNA (cytosine-5)-methyltransferase 1
VILRALDLFCGAGGVSRGLKLAGFDVTGVDIRPQPRYWEGDFHQADAMTFPLDGFDFIWASPPCQKYTRMSQGLLQSQGKAKVHPDLVAPIRERLKASETPWVIENVMGAPLENPIKLCGSSFGLLVERHRIFETSFMAFGVPCAHHEQSKDKPALHCHTKNMASRVVGCYGGGRGKGDNVALWREAMGIDWMTRKEMAQAIPPAYAEFIGRQAIRAISALKEAA